MQASEIKQGDIVFTSFDPSKGHEQKGTRPALVVSNNDFQRLTGGMAKVLPISTTSNEFPLHIPLPNGLKVHGKALVQQETTLDFHFRPFRYVDHVPSEFLAEILEIINETY